MGRMTTHILWNRKAMFQTTSQSLFRRSVPPRNKLLKLTTFGCKASCVIIDPAAEDNLHSLSFGYILIKLAIANTRGFENSACLGNLLLNFFPPISTCHDQNWSMKPT